MNFDHPNQDTDPYNDDEEGDETRALRRRNEDGPDNDKDLDPESHGAFDLFNFTLNKDAGR